VNLPVTTTPEADAQIRKIDDWWRENRRASPNLFFDELSGALDVSMKQKRAASLHETHDPNPRRAGASLS